MIDEKEDGIIDVEALIMTTLLMMKQDTPICTRECSCHRRVCGIFARLWTPSNSNPQS